MDGLSSKSGKTIILMCGYEGWASYTHKHNSFHIFVVSQVAKFQKRCPSLLMVILFRSHLLESLTMFWMQQRPTEQLVCTDLKLHMMI